MRILNRIVTTMTFDLPDNVVYKVESFGCTVSTKKKITENLQALIDRYAAAGWKLHSFEVILGDICLVVFYKQA